MCNCIELAEEALKNTNTMLDVPIRLSYQDGKLHSDRLLVATTKRDPKRREKAEPLFATYCPLCGKKYPDE